MRIFLEPNESLLFRTGRPFDAGETDYAETLFPPTPETIQGAVRTLLATAYNPSSTLPQLFNPGSELVKLIGDRESYGRFRITNIALAKRKQGSNDVELLYPVPAHLMRDNQGFFRLIPDKGEGVSSNMPAGMQYLVPTQKKIDGKLQSAEGWLSEDDLQSVLSANTDLTRIETVDSREIFVHEPRIGIGMDNATKSTRDGMFYSVQMLRMLPGHGFVVDVRLADETHQESLLPDQQTRNAFNLHASNQQGWAILGGEQRAASYRIVGESRPLPHVTTSSGQHTLLYLATPAALKNGWRPEKWPGNQAPIAAAIPRYQSIGGWKLHLEHSGGENKCMRRCVPAGSVYFFDSSVAVPSALTDYYGTEIGYGIIIAGEW